MLIAKDLNDINEKGGEIIHTYNLPMTITFTTHQLHITALARIVTRDKLGTETAWFAEAIEAREETNPIPELESKEGTIHKRYQHFKGLPINIGKMISVEQQGISREEWEELKTITLI